MINLEEKRAKQNLIGKEGTIIDATIVEAPIQHNGKEENEQIKQIEKILKKKKIEGRICERGYRNKPLTQKQKERNRAKSKIRARIEHGERFYDEYDERYICENDRISSCNIVNNNDEPYV